MSNAQIGQPRLITVDGGAKEIHARFRCWPDSVLSGAVLEQLVDQPERLPPEAKAALLGAGLLLQDEAGLRSALPVFERLPLARWRAPLGAALQDNAATLLAATERLREKWSGLSKLPAWPEIAHSLLLGYLLWGCGSQLLLKLGNCQVLAVIVAAPDSSAGVWHGFLRCNQDNGVSALLGEPFAEAERVQALLRRPEVGQALHSLAADKSLLALHPQALRILQRLAGLVSEAADESGLHHLAWPVLDSRELRLLRDELLSLLRSVSRLMAEAVPSALALTATELDWLQPGDLALAVFALLVRALADLWTQAGLLPQPAQPRLADLR